MSELKYYINTEIEIPINLVPIVDESDFTTPETALVYNEPGLMLLWNFVSASNVHTVTEVTPAETGDYEWRNLGNGMYGIVIPASGGATVNNDTAGFGWFSGKCDASLSWRGPTIVFQSTRTSSTVIYTGDEPPDEPISTLVEGISGYEEVNALSLYRYARIMNINPVHLSTSGDISLADGSVLFPLDGSGRFYQQRPYFQSEHVSREEIVEEIAYAESQVEDFLRTFVAPKWVSGEPVDLKNHYLPGVGYTVYDIKNARVKYLPKWGSIISGGQRGSYAIAESVPVVFSDPDGDGFNELATISFALDYEDTSLYEVKCYFAGYNGSPQYEIRPPLTKSKSGANVEITVETWKLINPVLYERYPTNDGNRIISLLEAGNIVASVDIYRKYNSRSSSHATFFYETSDSVFDDSEQDGYIKVSDPNLNTVQIIPATYNSDLGTWERAPILGTLRNIKINYYSGFSYRPQFGTNFWDELHPDLAQAIAYIATSRLSRPLAGKADTVALSTMLQEDYGASKQGSYRFVTNDIEQSPFGTRAGEVYAWRRLMHFQQKFMRYNNV